MAVSRPKLLIDRLPPHPAGQDLAGVVDKLRAGPHRVKLDASRVEVLTPGALEALLVVQTAQSERGDAFTLENPSAPFLSDLALYGLPPDHFKGPGT